MKNSIIKKLIILLLISINVSPPKVKLDQYFLSLHNEDDLAPRNNLRNLKIHPVKIEYFYVGVRCEKHINGQLIIRPIEELDIVAVA